MGQGKSKTGNTRRHRALAEISLENAIRPNGIFPPEIVWQMLSSADLKTFRICALSCKLWYETSLTVYQNLYLKLFIAPEDSNIDWKKAYLKQNEIRENIAKGFPRFNFSYEASCEGNKIICNNHHINPTSYGPYKFFKRGFTVDLQTLKTEDIAYGSMCANGYILQSNMSDNNDSLDWVSFEVKDLNGKPLQKIKRKNALPVDENPLYYSPPARQISLLVNLNGSPNVIIYNGKKSQPSDDKATKNTIIVEAYDLTTGELKYEVPVDATEILGYYDHYIVIITKDGVKLFDLKKKSIEKSFGHHSTAINIFDRILAVADQHVVKFYDLSSLHEINKIDVTSAMHQKDDQISGVTFDKWKCVVSFASELNVYHAVFDTTKNGKMIQRLFNPYDTHWHSDVKVYLPPNGKIVTDARQKNSSLTSISRNLTVYDFSHPNIDAKISVILALEGGKVQRHVIKALDLVKFTTQKLKSPLENLQARTFFKESELDRPARVTVIRATTSIAAWNEASALHDYLNQWEANQELRSAFQLTSTRCEFESRSGYPGTDDSHSAILSAKEYVLVFESKNDETNTWEFCEPFLTDKFDVEKAD